MGRTYILVVIHDWIKYVTRYGRRIRRGNYACHTCDKPFSPLCDADPISFSLKVRICPLVTIPGASLNLRLPITSELVLAMGEKSNDTGEYLFQWSLLSTFPRCRAKASL